MKFEEIQYRYSKNYITDSQLLRFKNLNIITEEEYAILYNEKHPKLSESVESVESE